ncbi:hypothetical protein B0T16DRAFT_428685 [Cercophora newfieldiana]|uniref:PH domain-containing protein n=1 Tax=Cercophora newfieldiana TaxID=92897 RepID=A0AA39Y6W1_9PEZI|nr:hypothetical protein B0T16DRAFT_428685 [Cercophora newfieldiana]
MPDTSQVPPGATLEFLNSHASQSRRARPPHLDPEAGYVERVPLRPEADSKLRRRESRLGLRNIFGWNKATPSDKAPGSPITASRPAMDGASRPGGIRASIAELNWPYGLSNGGAQRSEITLPSLSIPMAQALKHKKSASMVRSQAPPTNTKGTLATWEPPPLFKAYPQAIKHSHLPACTASAEAILRLHKSGFAQSSMALDMFEDSGAEKHDKAKKKHRRNASNSSLKLEWTTKVLVLVTSGYLLQYTGSGSFDRLPEKILHLGKDSAAFASDVIPGRHWVLQVCSVAEPDRTTTPSSSSSLFSRLPFRAQERKQASNLLMVFEGAEEMDSWITTLRREIEALGGRKYLSETGKPKVDDIEVQLRSQTSQRTLVVRDPDRFSRVMSPEMQWDTMMAADPPDIHLDAADADIRDQSFDDTSTASGISHDGRQLDGLRDSTNRLSFISSGQRTVITSAGSSPACSPIRDSFATADDGYVPDIYLQEEPPRPRARPNAAAINDRRQSMQTMNHLFEMRVSSAQVLRPHSTAACPSTWQLDTDNSVQPLVHTIPNFSVPQGMGKRYSVGRPIPAEHFQSSATFPSRVSSRRPPPTALAINGRPLSLVEDQPSPLSPPLSEDGVFSSGPDTPSMFPPWSGESNERRDNNLPRPPPLPLSPAPQDIIRPKSSLDFYSRAQSPTTMLMNEALRTRRLSLYAQDVEKPVFDHREYPLRSRTPSLKPVPRSSQHLRVDSLSKSLLQRRSLSQLAEGPPPGPPPTRALPPIPRKLSGPHGKMI